jgi:hypothetical protein
MRSVVVVVLSLLAVLISTPAAQTSPDALVPGPLRSYSTIHSIGVEWDVTGDADHDASATIQYRRRGTTAWQQALPLVRVDYNGSNMLAGSLLFLTPNTEYDVNIALTDPDGGTDARQFIVRTRPIPVSPSGGRVLHVVPGAGGGDGSLAAPYAGVAAAQAAAQPGDTFLLHAGDYGGQIRFDRAGTAANYIAWKAAGDGEVRIHGVDVAASHIWLEGLTVRDLPFALISNNSPTNVVVTRCRFLNNSEAIALYGAGTNWYIADNTIVGNTPPASGSLVGEGVELAGTSGHTVAYNSITHVADGISSPHTNVDIVGNDIFDTSDDGIELDNGRANVRVWGNRIHNAVHNGISFQPQSSAPWYIVRNQIVGSVEAALKFRTTDRFVLLHNTIVHWGDAWPGSSMMCCNEWDLLRAYARNNLWVSIQGGQIWGFETHTRDWRSDLDYDAFDWGSSTEPFTYEGATFPDVWSFSSASGLEVNAVRISHTTCFSDFRVPGPSPASVPPHVMTLQPSCEAVDSGAVLPNINEGFIGSAPDRGAHEYGHSTATYGPRPLGVPPPTAAEIVLYAAEAPTIVGQWQPVTDATAAGGRRLHNPDAGAAKLATAMSAPTSYFELTFSAEAGRPYRLWIRGKAERDHWENDSAFVQFSGSVDTNGTPVYRIGTTSATRYSLESCSGCGLSGWGWEDNGWGTGVLGPEIFFATSGTQRIRIQQREDGLSIDQIVLSSVKYLTASPGTTKDDTVILPRSDGSPTPPPPPPPPTTEIVLNASEAVITGTAWRVEADSTAAGGKRMWNPNAGVPKFTTPVAEPASHFELTFTADAKRPYRLWIRGRAEGDHWENDSAFVQFSGSVDASGTPVYRIGTSSATRYSLESCNGCGLSAWGWEDNGWGTGVLGPEIYFATAGTQRIRIQPREDGLSIDQIVLSAERYLTTAPGATKNDSTLLTK